MTDLTSCQINRLNIFPICEIELKCDKETMIEKIYAF